MKSKVHLGNATERKRGNHRPQTALAVAVELVSTKLVKNSTTTHRSYSRSSFISPVEGTKDFAEIYVFAQRRFDAILNPVQRSLHGFGAFI